MPKRESVTVGLSARQLAIFKKRLMKLKEKTQEELARADKKYNNLMKSYRNNPNIESADGTSPPYEEGMLVGGLSRKLRNIDRALVRIKAGSYGICADPECGENIELERLRARPMAEFCGECQDTRERKRCCSK